MLRKCIEEEPVSDGCNEGEEPVSKSHDESAKVRVLPSDPKGRAVRRDLRANGLAADTSAT
jgi:hypothetical protein